MHLLVRVSTAYVSRGTQGSLGPQARIWLFLPTGATGTDGDNFKVKVKVQVPWMFSHSRVTTVSYRDTEYGSKYILCTSTRVLFMHGRKSKFHDPSSCSNAFVRVAWGCLATETLGRGKGAHQSGGLWSTTVWAS